jgi:hypothetical protein
MFEDISSHRAAIANNIAKSFGDNKPDEDLDIVKAFADEFGSDFEKARMPGDVITYNGKTYVWSPTKVGSQTQYNWHVVQQGGSKIVEGTGVNGKHGVNALKEIFLQINGSFDDVTKFNLRRTPKGNWRLIYDGNDTGRTINGDVITESELKNDNVLYQRRNIVDNFDLVKNYMTFDSPDDVYFVQVIKRWKDNKDKPDAWQWKMAGKAKGSYHSGAEYLDYYIVHSPQELDKIKDDIIKSASYNNARAYISINSRSEQQTKDYVKQVQARHANNPNDPRYKNAEPIAYGMAKSGKNWQNVRLRVLLDVDTTKDKEVKINGKKVNVWQEVRDRLAQANIKVAAEYETPSGGLHLILNNKNNKNLRPFYSGLKDFDGGIDLDKNAMVHPSEDIKMVLYSNVDTEGY